MFDHFKHFPCLLHEKDYPAKTRKTCEHPLVLLLRVPLGANNSDPQHGLACCLLPLDLLGHCW